jgi:hypothetical protein
MLFIAFIILFALLNPRKSSREMPLLLVMHGGIVPMKLSRQSVANCLIYRLVVANGTTFFGLWIGIR